MAESTVFPRSVSVLFVWLILILIGSPYTLAADKPYIIKQYTDEDNLPQNSIKGIGQDNLGFVWLISENGPIRYDGSGRFKTFDSLSMSLKSVRMSVLYKGNPAGDLLARAERGEKVLLKDGKATLIKGDRDLVSRLISGYSADTYISVSLPSLYSQYDADRVFIPDGAGAAFVLSGDSIIRMANQGKKASAICFPNSDIWQFACYQGKLMYFTQTHEYIEFGDSLEPQKKRISGDFPELPPGTPLKIYANSSSQQLFLLAADNFYHLTRGPNGNLQGTLLVEGFDFERNNIITALYNQNSGRLLLGSSTKGLFVITRSVFRSLSADTDDLKDVSYNQTALPNGLLLTNNGVAYDRLGNARRLPLLQRESFQHGQIIGPDGNLWILEHDTILIVSPISLVFATITGH